MKIEAKKSGAPSNSKLEIDAIDEDFKRKAD
jgi:hypothetical protein